MSIDDVGVECRVCFSPLPEPVDRCPFCRVLVLTEAESEIREAIESGRVDLLMNATEEQLDRLRQHSNEAGSWAHRQAKFMEGIAELLERTGAESLGDGFARGLFGEDEVHGMYASAHGFN